MRGPVAARVALAVALAAMPVTAVTGSQAAERRQAQLAVASTTAELPMAGTFRSVRSYAQVPEPVRLRIPAAGVDTALVRLGRAADGSIEVPAQFDVAGWYDEGPRPGQPGPAVVLGHVDSRTGPAVFFRVAALPRDAQVLVDRADGSTVVFRVSGTQRVPKVEFPTDRVYGPTLEPSLRLVTCGGSFDRVRGNHRGQRDRLCRSRRLTRVLWIDAAAEQGGDPQVRFVAVSAPALRCSPWCSGCSWALRWRRPVRRSPGDCGAGGDVGRGVARLTVDMPGDEETPGSVTVTVGGAPQAARVVPAVRPDRDGRGGRRLGRRGPQLQPGLSGSASFVLTAPPAARSALVADKDPPAVVAPLAVGSSAATLARRRPRCVRAGHDAPRPRWTWPCSSSHPGPTTRAWSCSTPPRRMPAAPRPQTSPPG